MTNEELDLEMTQVNSKIALIVGDENKLSGRLWREKVMLRQQKDCLDKIRKARDGGNITQEAKQMATYSILKDAKTRHPLITYIMQLKFRSHIY
jgi:hypothetical protein